MIVPELWHTEISNAILAMILASGDVTPEALAKGVVTVPEPVLQIIEALSDSFKLRKYIGGAATVEYLKPILDANITTPDRALQRLENLNKQLAQTQEGWDTIKSLQPVTLYTVNGAIDITPRRTSETFSISNVNCDIMYNGIPKVSIENFRFDNETFFLLSFTPEQFWSIAVIYHGQDRVLSIDGQIVPPELPRNERFSLAGSLEIAMRHGVPISAAESLK